MSVVLSVECQDSHMPWHGMMFVASAVKCKLKVSKENHFSSVRRRKNKKKGELYKLFGGSNRTVVLSQVM